MQLHDQERLDRAIDQFERIIRRLDGRQSVLEHRITTLYQVASITFAVIIFTLSFLVIILSTQVPGMTAAIENMNLRFGRIADNMVRMERTVLDMENYMSTLSEIIANVDHVHGSVADMTGDVGQMGEALAAIDSDLGRVSATVADMRDSFAVMEHRVREMGRDVNRMSQPMRLFNQFNPLVPPGTSR